MQCKRCGICCKYSLIRLFDKDIERISSKEPFVVDFGKEKFLAKNEKGCIFLEEIDGICFCKIYPNRPDVCRDLEPSDECSTAHSGDVLKARILRLIDSLERANEQEPDSDYDFLIKKYKYQVELIEKIK